MNIIYPHIIENCVGEKIIFHGIEKEAGEDKVIVENFVTPGNGPVMHTHFLQDEELTVVEGKLAYQVMGEMKHYANKGETVFFKRGTPHRFWNAGQQVLNCKGWIKPANSIVFFLTALYAAQNKSGKDQPDKFDGAYLMTRYATEYDLPEIPRFVKKTILPLTCFIGKLLGKYKDYNDAPEPIGKRKQ